MVCSIQNIEGCINFWRMRICVIFESILDYADLYFRQLLLKTFFLFYMLLLSFTDFSLVKYVYIPNCRSICNISSILLSCIFNYTVFAHRCCYCFFVFSFFLTHEASMCILCLSYFVGVIIATARFCNPILRMPYSCSSVGDLLHLSLR